METGESKGDDGDFWRDGMEIGPGRVETVASVDVSTNNAIYPNTNSYINGIIGQTGIRIYDISASGDVMSFSVEGLSDDLTLPPTLLPISGPSLPPTPLSTPEPTFPPTLLPTPGPTLPPTPLPTSGPPPTLLPISGPKLPPNPLPTPGPSIPPTPLQTPGPTLPPTQLPIPGPTLPPTPLITPEPTLPFTLLPTPGPVPPPSDVPEPPFTICFSGRNMVRTKERGYIRMEDVEIGDMVHAGHNKYSRVYSFGHRNQHNYAQYLQLHFGDHPLEISHNHMVFVDKLGAVPASMVGVGDNLSLGTGGVIKVTRISTVNRQGEFAPFTDSGTIVVSDILVSSYISLQEEQSSNFQVAVE